MEKYKVIDLFAGAGGLSLGFEQSGAYEIKAAFENNPKMQETYRRNHPTVELFSNVCDADYRALEEKYGPIDVVIGGPPCQGFSNANRQRNHAISKNNMLVKQYIRAIVELQPKAFIMENVSMLKSDVHRFYMEKHDADDVKALKIPIKPTEIHLLDSKYLFKGAEDIIQDAARINEYLWPNAIYSSLNVLYKASKNKSKLDAALKKHKGRLLKFIQQQKISPQAGDFIVTATHNVFAAVLGYYSESILADDLIASIEPAIMLQRMLQKALEIIDNDIIVTEFCTKNGLSAKVDSFAVFDYLKAVLESPQNGYIITSKVLCAADYGAPQKRMRFVVAGIKRSIAQKIALPIGYLHEGQYRTVYDAISDLEDTKAIVDVAEDQGIDLVEKDGLSDLGKILRNSPTLYNHIVTKTTKVAMERFRALKQGQNFHSLDDKLKNNTYTNAGRTQNTIYLRLKYDEPCGTVVNVRKSMWIHPTLNRAISVREAARLQTFPDSFIFCGTKDSQYQQVGNAVPPIMAESIAKELSQVLSKNLSQEVRCSG